MEDIANIIGIDVENSEQFGKYVEDKINTITIGNELLKREYPTAYDTKTGICVKNKAIPDMETTDKQRDFNNTFDILNDSKKSISTIFYILDDFLMMYPNSHILNKAFFVIFPPMGDPWATR